MDDPCRRDEAVDCLRGTRVISYGAAWECADEVHASPRMKQRPWGELSWFEADYRAVEPSCL
jgi:hypothetical protein